MGEIHATMNISIDGCCDHTQALADDEFHVRMSDLFGRAKALLFGRNTYDLLHAYWPGVASSGVGSAGVLRLAQVLDRLPKYVASPSLARAILQWKLVDQYHVAISPMVAGHGPQFLAGLAGAVTPSLMDIDRLRSGVIILRYDFGGRPRCI